MADCYIALLTKRGEVNKSDYCRMAIRQWTFDKRYGIFNTNDIVFSKMQTDWGKITHSALCSEREGGKQYVKRSVTHLSGTPKKGSHYKFAVGALTIMFEGD